MKVNDVYHSSAVKVFYAPIEQVFENIEVTD